MRSYYPSGNAWRRAIGSLRHESLGTFAFKLAAELGYRRVLMLARPLDEPVADADPASDVGLLGEGEIGDYLALRPDEARKTIVARLAEGQQCFVLRRDGCIVSSCWASRTRAWSSFLQCDIPLEDGDVYLTDAWTKADLRGHGYAHVLCLHQLRYFRAGGFRRAMRLTVPENHSARRLHSKSGFAPIATLVQVRIGPRRRLFRRAWRGTPA